MSCGTPYRNAARVIKTRGLEGKVHAQCAEGLPFCIYEGLRVHVVPPILNFPRKLDVVEVADIDDHRCVVQFKQISNIEDAEKLVGHSLLVHEDDLEEVEGYGYESLLGREVVDEKHGNLGTITEYIETRANDVIVVFDGSREVLIPLIESVIVDIPEDDELPILTKVMEGLVN